MISPTLLNESDELTSRLADCFGSASERAQRALRLVRNGLAGLSERDVALLGGGHLDERLRQEVVRRLARLDLDQLCRDLLWIEPLMLALRDGLHLSVLRVLSERGVRCSLPRRLTA